MLPTDAGGAVWPARLAAEHALAGLPEAAEPLRVHVQELPGALAFIAARTARRSRRRSRQPRVPVPAQHLADRRRRVRDQASQPHRAIGRAKPRRDDPLLGLNRQTTWLTTRRRRPVAQRRPTTRLIAPPK